MSSCKNAALRWEEEIHGQHARFAGKENLVKSLLSVSRDVAVFSKL